MAARGSGVGEAVRRAGEALGAAADVEAPGEDAFGGDAALGGLPHDVPEGEDGGVDLLFGGGGGFARGGRGAGDAELGGVLEEGDLVGEDEVGDGEVVLGGEGEELGGARVGVGDGAGAGGGAAGVELGGGEDEAASDGEEGVLVEDLSGSVAGGEGEAVGVCGGGGIGVHPVAVEEEVVGVGKGDGVGA